jgi:putative nucleotidyltransferase with HDIG domain
MKEGIGRVADFVHEYLMETGKQELDNVWGSKYRWEHTLRVAYWSWRLANEEKANVEKCVVAALLHDVSHFASEDYRKHGYRSAEIAHDFLLEESYPDGFVEDVVYAVRSHVGEPNPKTMEAKILQDADTLDRFGSFRILLFGKTAELLDVEKLKERVQSFSEYLAKVERGEFGPMWTKTGERKLKELINIYKAVLKGVLEELKHTKAPETYFES